jgi:nitrate reductase delta subunit
MSATVEPAATHADMTHREACRVLARLLSYPDDEMLALLPAIADWTSEAHHGLSWDARSALATLIAALAQADPIDAQAAYVDCFDRGRRTSLHLFEHVLGDSRDRGPAMIDLHLTYARAGLELAPGELPDYLPAVLEFASTQPAGLAREFLGEMAHVLNALHAALVQRASPYAAVIAAVLELAGAAVERTPVADEEPLDQAWAEPEPFGGCSSAGQQRPGRPQPIHIVRRTPPLPGAAA